MRRWMPGRRSGGGLIMGLIIVAGGVVTAPGLSAATATTEQAVRNQQFLDQHWQRPLPPQGPAPEQFGELEASLDPRACGTCHPQQFEDWSTSLHSKAMGPGLMGQLLDMPAHARSDHQACLRCHAPLAEQADSLVAELEGGTLAIADNAAGLPGLHRQGLVCAACHVREHQRYGPARRDGTSPAATETLPHNGWQVSDAFEDSRFCAACHQFQADEFALNGKLLENTYVEWQESRYAQEGISCQHCHMPDRRHQWRGIHDPEMVRDGISVDTQGVSLNGAVLNATMTLTNSGTGHRFPTYVTPQVVMEGFQESADSERIAGSESYWVVARRVALNLSEEIFDTRLAPGESATLLYDLPRDPRAAHLVFRIWVEPDFFYEQFYLSLLESGQSNRGTEALQQALAQAQQSLFTVYEQRIALPALHQPQDNRTGGERP